MRQRCLQPASLSDALALLDEQSERTRVVAGGTDVLVELQRGGKPAQTLNDSSKVNELRFIRAEGDDVVLGGLSTHNDVLASNDCLVYGLRYSKRTWKLARRRFGREPPLPATS